MAATKVIESRSYSFGNIVPTDALRVEIAIVRVIGEPLFKAMMTAKPGGKKQLAVVDAAANDEKAKEDQMIAMMAAMSMLAAKMDAEEMIALFNIVFKYITCDGQRIQIDSTFVGRNREIWMVIGEALRYNFSDFFPASLSNSLKEKLAAFSL